MKKFFIFLMLCCLSAGAFAQTKAKAVKAPGDTVDCTTFKAAVDTLNKYNGGTVLVSADDVLNETVNINSNITVLPYGGSYTLSRATTMTDTMFIIQSNKNFILGSMDATHSITIDGNNAEPSKAPLFFVRGNLYLRDSVYIINNHLANNVTQAAVIRLSHVTSQPHAKCYIEGYAVISGNTTNNAPIIAAENYSQLYISNGLIENNTVNGSDVLVTTYSTVKLTGGTLQNNTCGNQVKNGTIGFSTSNAISQITLGDSIRIIDPQKIACDSNKTIELSANLTKHSSTDPILLKVNYQRDRQLLTGDATIIAANYMKFKPVDVNGKQVRIRKDGVLTDKWPMYSVKAGTTDTMGHLTLKAAVDTLNANGGGTVLADSNETLTQTVVVNSDITILAHNGNITISRGNDLGYYKNLLTVEENNKLTLSSLGSTDTLFIDGANIPSNQAMIESYGIINLMDNVVLQNGIGNINSSTGSNAGGAICMMKGATNILGKAIIRNNVSGKGGAIYAHTGRLAMSSPALISGNKAKGGAAFYIYTSAKLIMSNGLVTGNTLIDTSEAYEKGIIFTYCNNDTITGGSIINNYLLGSHYANEHIMPAAIRYTGYPPYCHLGDSLLVDTLAINYYPNLFNSSHQQLQIISNLTKASEENPIILLTDSIDFQALRGTNDILINNYKKFKVAADTLTINRKGWVVRKPEIKIDSIYLVQRLTKFSDYGITTIAPDSVADFNKDYIYIEYTQTVDASGNTNSTRSDSTILEMKVTYAGATNSIRQKVGAQNNGKLGLAIPFNSADWTAAQPSAGKLDSGLYKVEIDTLIVHTLGISAGDKKSIEKDVNIPYISIDTVNFLLAGTKFSDYHHCGVGATTNDGDGADVVPGNEIYVEYTRTGEIDSASVTVAIKGNNQNVSYKESTPSGTTLGVGCGSFRSFLDNSGIGQFVENSDMTTPAPLTLADDSSYLCSVWIRVKAANEPYHSMAMVMGKIYTHNIDREAIFALDTANNRNDNYNMIGITLTNTNDSLALNYPSAFSVAKARELGMVDNTDNCVYVVLTADPVDTTIRVESANNAKSLGTDLALNSTNYSTTGYGIQDGKLLMAVKVSAPIQANDVVVPALNFSKDSALRWCSVIGEITGIDNPYKTFRTLYKISGKTANDTTVVADSQMTYRSTGVSGVKLHASNGQASYMFHPEDYTVWPSQDPTPGLTLDGKVWLALYVAAPNTNVKKVYNPALNTPYSTNTDSIVTLQDALAKRVTTTEAVNYYPVGTCANYATKDYTFYHTGDAPYNNNYLYWFDENSKLLSVQKYDVAVKKAPIYTVNYNFNGGGATCNTPYADNFADTTYIFGRKINRPADPFKCGNLFMDWYEGTSQFLTVDSFKNVRNGNTGIDTFGIRANHNLNATWRYFVTLSNPHDTAVVADYSLCEINVRDYVWEPTEAQLPYVYTFHTDYLGNYYRDYLATGNANCNVRFDANAFTENPTVLPVGQTSLLSWSVTDMCGTPFTISQNVNVKFPPCGADNYNPHLFPFTPYDTTYKAKDYEGNLYETVRMGCDCWTRDNLKSLQYTDGTDVAVAKAYLNIEENADTYGRLYTWYSAVKLPEGTGDAVAPLNADNKPQGICPTGWYLPSEEDFARMSNLSNIDGESVGVKSEGTNNHWLGNEVGTNATGFNALPAGFYNSATDRYFNLIGDAYFWSSSTTSTASAPCCALTHSCPSILITDNNKGYGYSIRCIKYQKFDY